MNLRLRIEQQSGTENYRVTAIVQFHDHEDNIKQEIKEDTIETLGEIFEVETMSAEVLEKGQTMEISIETQNTEKIQSLKKNMLKLFRKESGLGNDKIHLN